MTGSEYIFMVRFLIQEATGKFWDDVEIIKTLNIHLLSKALKLANSSAEYYWDEFTYTLVESDIINGSRILLPNGILYNNQAKMNAIGLEALFYNGDTIPLPSGDVRFFDDNFASISEIAIRGKYLLFNGTLSVGDTIKMRYWYSPVKITDANKEEEVDYPESFSEVLFYESAIMCIIKDEGDIADLEYKLKGAKINMNETLGNRIRTNPTNTYESFGG